MSIGISLLHYDVKWHMIYFSEPYEQALQDYIGFRLKKKFFALSLQ